MPKSKAPMNTKRPKSRLERRLDGLIMFRSCACDPV
jgi:hypothetical protein